MEKVKIVILDACPTNPGDLSWEELGKLGELTVHDRCPKDREEILRRCQGAQVVLNNKVVFTADMLEALPDLRLIAMQATGYNNVDVAAAARLGIAVCNVPGYSTDSVAQLTFALVLALCSRVAEQDAALKGGLWNTMEEYAPQIMGLRDLAGSTLGLYGFGAIGRKVGEIGRAFGMRVIYHCHAPKDAPWAEYVPLETLFRESDVLSLHAPLTPETREVVCRRTLDLMKPSALFVNTARGGLMNEPEVAAALNEGRLAGAGIDVFTVEPPEPGNPLLTARNCLVTPHVAWASYKSRKRLVAVLTEIVRTFLAGSPINRVN